MKLKLNKKKLDLIEQLPEMYFIKIKKDGLSNI